jgi:hypothetical protein
MTWLLQPLDTHVFALLKRRIHAKQEELRAADVNGEMRGTQWLDAIEAGIHEVLVNRDWRRAMLENGATGEFAHLRRRISRFVPQADALPLAPPSDAELREMVGRARPGLAARLTRWAGGAAPPAIEEHVEAPPLLEDVPAVPPPAPPPALPQPIAHRTRSRLRLL